MLRMFIFLLLSVFLYACSSTQEKNDNFRIADTNVRLGVGYLQQGRIDAALEKLQKALEVMPDYPEAHSSIALVYEQMQENDKAAEHYERALDLKPGDGITMNNYAVLLCRVGKPLEAEKYFLQAISSRGYRTPAQAYENLGVCSLQIPDLKKAEGYLRRALQMNPKLPNALLQMAKISYEKGNYLSGRAYLQRYREVSPHTPESLWLGIQVETKLGAEDVVQTYSRELLRTFPDSSETRRLLELEMGSKKP